MHFTSTKISWALQIGKGEEGEGVSWISRVRGLFWGVLHMDGWRGKHINAVVWGKVRHGITTSY
jgi:hypothetical protein